LLSKAERSFFGVLRQAVGDEYLIFAKVRLADLFWIPKRAGSRQRHLNRVSAKHIDFVLCDHEAIRPLLAIELDDSSHARSDRRSRDAFVDAALAAAGLPLVRIRARTGYNVGELKAAIGAAFQDHGDSAHASANNDSG
jgi:very-short-patch-repair endonuclease